MNFIKIAFCALCLCTQIKGYVVSPENVESSRTSDEDSNEVDVTVIDTIDFLNDSRSDFNNCSSGVRETSLQLPDVDTGEIYPEFPFNASWISRKYFWNSKDFDFETRYVNHVNNIRRNHDIVKVFVLPHSHNDPGWLDTYLQYYYRQTRNILDNAVEKLSVHRHMTFVWSETTYLARWWKEIDSSEKQKFLDLVEEGRLEIATGGWVVPDEATPSLYALVTELTEGQQWIRNNLNITAHHSWAIDPFGHSATHSHLLKSSGMDGMVIQRLHYNWKHYLAEHKMENFLWRPRWDTSGSSDIPCHTLPFDLYSIKHACGPDPPVCLKFDFRSIDYEYGENYGRMTPINRSNVRKLAEEIVEQYLKTASLTDHNVVLVPLGDDFRYDRPQEWDQQYVNYMRLFTHINYNKDRYRMDIRFGTLRDYFEAVSQKNKEANRELKTLSGDFFPYGDVYASGEPSYWTGFYGTRPYWKKFHRELENELRSAEILFTYANNLASQANSFVEVKTLSYLYLDLVNAREEFSVFCHHDGITGTSRRWTMEDYGDRLHGAYQKCINVQIQSLKLIHKHVTNKTLPPVTKDIIRESFDNLPMKIPLEIFSSAQYTTNLMIFNNLGWRRSELIKVQVKSPDVEVYSQEGDVIPAQINPVLIHNEREDSIDISDRAYELVFIANLEPLTFSSFQIKQAWDPENSTTLATFTCTTCGIYNHSVFPVEENTENQEAFKLENSEKVLHFQSNGLLERVEMKGQNKSVPISMSFGLYKPVNRLSGAYLLKPSFQSEWKFFKKQEYPIPHVIKISGPIMSQVITIHSTQNQYETLKVNTTLVNSENDDLSKKIFVENYIDFSRDYSSKMEIFMRFDTGLNSTRPSAHSHNPSAPNNSTPVLYTDQNSLYSAKRILSPHGYESNVYPVTTTAHIQDEEGNLRFSVLVDRTHGFNSMESGRLETLVQRKSLYDDGRGLSEGVTEVKASVSNYVLLLEEIEPITITSNGTEDPLNWQPTLLAYASSHRLNYPPNLFVFNEPEPAENGTMGQLEKVSLISAPLPPDLHLLNLRTLSKNTPLHRDFPGLDEIAGNEALLNLRRFEYHDQFQNSNCSTSSERKPNELFQVNFINVTKIIPTTLTASVDQIGEDNGNNTVLFNYKIQFV